MHIHDYQAREARDITEALTRNVTVELLTSDDNWQTTSWVTVVSAIPSGDKLVLWLANGRFRACGTCNNDTFTLRWTPAAPAAHSPVC
jgi:hypothetical protein